jgi:hypothetical protein
MPKMKFWPILLALALIAACGQQKTAPAKAPSADNPENRQAAAKQYLEIAPPQELLHDMTAGVSERLPEKLRQPFAQVIASQSLKDAVYQVDLKALVKHFTPNELQAMTAFYSTPEGKSIRQKYSAYMAEVIGGTNMEIMTAFKKAVPKDILKPEAPGKKPAAPPQPPVKPAPPAAKPAPPASK